jgi:hypothetical protein
MAMVLQLAGEMNIKKARMLKDSRLELVQSLLAKMRLPCLPQKASSRHKLSPKAIRTMVLKWL